MNASAKPVTYTSFSFRDTSPHAHMHTHTHTHTNAHTRTHAHTHTCTYTHKHTHTHIHIHIHFYTCTHTNTSTHSHTPHTHACIRTYTPSSLPTHTCSKSDDHRRPGSPTESDVLSLISHTHSSPPRHCFTCFPTSEPACIRPHPSHCPPAEGGGGREWHRHTL